MKITIRKIARYSKIPGETALLPSDDSVEYHGELVSPLVEGLPVSVVYWRRGNEPSLGTLSTGELVARGDSILSTADGLYSARFIDAEDRAGRKRARSFIAGTHNGKFSVPLRWRQATPLRRRCDSLWADPYTLAVSGLPFAQDTGFSEAISSGVQRRFVEVASEADLERVERRLLILHRALSSNVKRQWRGVADVDLREQFVIFPSAIQVGGDRAAMASHRFVSVVEPNRGRVLHATGEEFPLDEACLQDLRDFWRRLRMARQKAMH